MDPFRDLASSCGVPDAVADVLQQAGWNVTHLFSCWVASAAEVSTEVAKLGLPADLEDTPLLIASLRALWKACLAASETKGPLPTGVATSASVSSSWCWTFHPSSLYHSIMLMCTQKEHDPCQKHIWLKAKGKRTQSDKSELCVRK